MRRNALSISAALCLTFVCTGCNLFQKKTAQPQVMADFANDPIPAAPTSTADNYPIYNEPVMTSTPTMGTPIPTARFHTVARKDTLFSIARTYYNGDASRWRDIYDANRNDVSDPNMIRVGQRLAIP